MWSWGGFGCAVTPVCVHVCNVSHVYNVPASKGKHVRVCQFKRGVRMYAPKCVYAYTCISIHMHIYIHVWECGYSIHDVPGLLFLFVCICVCVRDTLTLWHIHTSLASWHIHTQAMTLSLHTCHDTFISSQNSWMQSRHNAMMSWPPHAFSRHAIFIYVRFMHSPVTTHSYIWTHSYMLTQSYICTHSYMSDTHTH